MRNGRRMRCAWMVAGSALVALAGSGCVGVVSNPSIQEGEGYNDPLTFAASAEVTAAAVRHVVSRWPVEGGVYAVNVAPGMKPSQYYRFLRILNDKNARPMTAENTGLPIIHVEALRVLGDEATVQVHRPVGLPSEQAPAPEGAGAVTQAMDVRVRGGVQAWRVVATRGWMLGAIKPPEIYIMPPQEEAPEFRGRPSES